jgi:hypothetical protein
MWEEWVNDLDGRDILAGVLRTGAVSSADHERVAMIDERVVSRAPPIWRCAWGDDEAARHGWTRETEWWYWLEPPNGYDGGHPE